MRQLRQLRKKYIRGTSNRKCWCGNPPVEASPRKSLQLVEINIDIYLSYKSPDPNKNCIEGYKSRTYMLRSL